MKPNEESLASLNKLTERIIACAITVHRVAGVGLREKDYETALCMECDANNIKYKRQLRVPFVYRKRTVSDYRIDVLVENRVVVDLKTVERFHPSHEAKVFNYMRRAVVRIGLLLNFQCALLKHGIRRFIL